MRHWGRQFRLWQVMLAIAVLAGLFALVGVRAAVAILTVALLVVFPVVHAAPRRKLVTAAWVASLYPMLLLGSLYATWFTAWMVLGHRPRFSLDDPKFISPIVSVLHDVTVILTMGLTFAFLSTLVLSAACIPPRSRLGGTLPRSIAAHVLVPLLSWLAFSAVVGWGLLGFRSIAVWFAD